MQLPNLGQPRYLERDKRDWRARSDAGRDNRQQDQLNLHFSETHISPQGVSSLLNMMSFIHICHKFLVRIHLQNIFYNF